MNSADNSRQQNRNRRQIPTGYADRDWRRRMITSPLALGQ